MLQVDYIIVRPRRDGYELLDTELKYLGFAETLGQAQRFAAEAGVPMVIEPPVRMRRPPAQLGAFLMSLLKRLTA